MSFYPGLRTIATNLLTNKGQLVTFSHDEEVSYNGGTGERVKTTTTFTGNGVALNYNKSEIDGELVQMNDIKFIMEATTTAPVIGDTTTIDGEIYRAMAVKPLSPAGVVVIYQVQLRK